MSDTANHRVAMHGIAMDRRARGLPSWAETIDASGLFHDDEKSFVEIRDAVALRIRASKWYRDSEVCSEIRDLVDAISESQDTEEFDGFWSDLYDMADYARVWINTRGGSR